MAAGRLLSVVGQENKLAFAQLWRATPPDLPEDSMRLLSLQGQSYANDEHMAEFHVTCASLSILEGERHRPGPTVSVHHAASAGGATASPRSAAGKRNKTPSLTCVRTRFDW